MFFGQILKLILPTGPHRVQPPRVTEKGVIFRVEEPSGRKAFSGVFFVELATVTGAHIGGLEIMHFAVRKPVPDV
jgi:hypothetical protein